MSENNWLSAVRFGPDGLVPVVAQEGRSGDVLMVAYADREALERTVTTGLAHYFSRSRQALWCKGETSGHEQRVTDVRLDCDGDTVLYRVEQTGPACHTGARTCFSSAVGGGNGGASLHAAEDPGGHLLSRLAGVIDARVAAESADLLYHVLVLLKARGVPLDAVLRELENRSR